MSGDIMEKARLGARTQRVVAPVKAPPPRRCHRLLFLPCFYLKYTRTHVPTLMSAYLRRVSGVNE